MPLPSVRLRRLLALGSAALTAWAGVVWLTGGGVLVLGWLRLSSRSAVRPGLLALILAAAALAGTTAAERRAMLARLRQALDRAASWSAALVALALALTSAVFGEHVAGGADSSGYVHQSQLWAEHRATLEAPVLDDGPWPEAGWEVAPLGFAPAVTVGTLGPAYAPGLPWLMALGATVAGEPGRYIWTPIAAGLLAWLTFVLARRNAPPSVALAATVLVASSPPVLFASMQTMSDLLCAGLWTAALVAIGRGSMRGAALAGAAAALALTVRPNLVLVAALVSAAAVVTGGGGWPARLGRAVTLAVPIGLAAAIIAWINLRLWGSPFQSGYGATEALFAAGNVPANVANLWRWTAETGAWWTLAAGPALVWQILSRGDRTWPALALVAGIVVSYLPYGVFAEWWYLRFYLPVWPVLAAAVAFATWRALDRWSADLAPVLVLALAVAIAGSAVTATNTRVVFGLWQSAGRYPAAAEWVRRQAPAGTVLLSVQHSGALAAAGVSTIARWDHVAPDALDARVTQLAVRGRTAWAVLDDWEEAAWRQRFTGQIRGRLDWAPVAEVRVGTSRVHVFDMTTPTRAFAPELIPGVSGGPWPWTRRLAASTPK